MKKKMIGFYDYTVILTYGGLVSALFGVFYVVNSRFLAAIVCLGISLICDTLDGKVARRKRNRTEQESNFGVQIDSLCDMVSFGVFPGIFFFQLGVSEKFDFLLIMGYYLCCVIRLGYFNVLAMDDNEEKGVFHGLPVVTMAIFIPLIYMVKVLWITDAAFVWALRGMLFLFALLYVLDFKFYKPKMPVLIVLFLIFWIPTTVLFFI